MARVSLNIAEWRAMFPQFGDEALTPDSLLTAQWPVAELLVGNTDRSRIPEDTRAMALYYVLCHLVTLQARGDVVGNVTSAAQGSVNAGLALMQRANSRWWEQTPCGLTAWELLRPWRAGGYYVRG